MSNNNAFWGKRFGFVLKETIDKTEVFSNAFRPRQWSSGKIISGPHQTILDPNSYTGKLAAKDRKAYAERTSNPVIRYRGSKRVAA